MTTLTKPKPLTRVVSPSGQFLLPNLHMTVTVPMCPPEELSPNARLHWRQRQPYKSAYRDAAYWAARAVRDATPGYAPYQRPAFEVGPIAVRVTIGWSSGRKRHDDDNAQSMIKAARDGIALGAGIDDRWFRLVSIEQVRDRAKVGWTFFSLTAENVAFVAVPGEEGL